MRDWSKSPPPGNRGSHLRGKYRDAGGEVPELRPYVPPTTTKGEEKASPRSLKIAGGAGLPNRPGGEVCSCMTLALEYIAY